LRRDRPGKPTQTAACLEAQPGKRGHKQSIFSPAGELNRLLPVSIEAE